MADDLPMNCRTPAIVEYDGTTDPVEHLAHFENAALLHRYTDGIKCRVFITTFARASQQWFNQLPAGAIGSFQEFRSLFLHQFASSRKLRKIELSLFLWQQKDKRLLLFRRRICTCNMEDTKEGRNPLQKNPNRLQGEENSLSEDKHSVHSADGTYHASPHGRQGKGTSG
ncbi:UNVERIFIED_CONTAM: hypothetical protein Slati_1099700 [Sesamum latifolium]|uniref:Retrotransposon gag domain-containing protein n=1 Tax=Sesamum latifolium TaxID=2727402 RepID=A0AAW2XDX6_9LAMI